MLYMLSAEYYKPFFIHIVLFMVLWTTSGIKLFPAKRRNDVMLIVVFFLIVFIGLRPLSEVFTDMRVYTRSFNLNSFKGRHGEYTWEFLMYLFHQLHLDVTSWFLFIAFGYVGLIWKACARIFRKRAWLGMIYFLSSFTFLNYGTNVLRNGLALSLILFGISILIRPKYKSKWVNYTYVIVIYLIAFGIHKSSILPALSSLIAFNLKNVRISFSVWIVCLLISYFVSDYTELLFTELDFDDRLESYLSNAPNADKFSHVGFRFDFLAFSVVPLILAYFIKKKVVLHLTYVHLLNTYLLSNSFWLLCIKANFSDRFAQLSWFMYPLLLLFPLIYYKVKNPKKYYNRALILFFLFSYLQWLI